MVQCRSWVASMPSLARIGTMNLGGTSLRVPNLLKPFQGLVYSSLRDWVEVPGKGRGADGAARHPYLFRADDRMGP